METKWTVEQIRTNILSNNNWLVRGMLAIYERQTADEQVSEQTNCNNNIGFNGVDAPILSSFVKQYLAKGFLSAKQMAIVKKKMPKYCRQLTNIANENSRK